MRRHSDRSPEEEQGERGPHARLSELRDNGELMLGQRALSVSGTRFEGDASLTTRPNGPLLDALRALGPDGTACGALYRVPSMDQSVQVRSRSLGASALNLCRVYCLLLPLLNSGSVVRVLPHRLEAYIELTIAMAKAFGLVFDEHLAVTSGF